jgi:hypothetical protein
MCASILAALHRIVSPGDREHPSPPTYQLPIYKSLRQRADKEHTEWNYAVQS